MSDLAELIAKLEGEERGHFSLDRAILSFAAGPDGWLTGREARALLTPMPPDGEPDAPPFTSSLDAALSLVPDTTDFLIKRKWCIGRAAHITDGTTVWSGEATTEALALCIAALKARSAA